MTASYHYHDDDDDARNDNDYYGENNNDDKNILATWKDEKSIMKEHEMKNIYTLNLRNTLFKSSSAWEKTAKSQKPSGIAESTRADRPDNLANKRDPCFSALTNHDALLERQSGHNFSITDLPKENKQRVAFSLAAATMARRRAALMKWAERHAECSINNGRKECAFQYVSAWNLCPASLGIHSSVYKSCDIPWKSEGRKAAWREKCTRHMFSEDEMRKGRPKWKWFSEKKLISRNKAKFLYMVKNIE